MTSTLDPAVSVKTVTLNIDGREVTVPQGTSVWDAAKTLGIEVPVLCHDPRFRPVGVCRMCVVEVEGARTLQASCVRPCESGMKVKTGSPDELADLYASLGADRAKFLVAFNGADATARLAKAREFGLRSGVQGTPTLIVNGKYRVKGREDTPLYLDPHSQILRLIQMIRDETHRYAITYHRKRRELRDFTSELSEIPGVGDKRKTRLLRQFGSIQKISVATVEELAPFVGRKTATEIADHFARQRTLAEGLAS